jgi:hypothetical protein
MFSPSISSFMYKFLQQILLIDMNFDFFWQLLLIGPIGPKIDATTDHIQFLDLLVQFWTSFFSGIEC